MLFIGTNDPRGAEVRVEIPNKAIKGFPKTISIPRGAPATVSLPTGDDGDIRVMRQMGSNNAVKVTSLNDASLQVIGMNDNARSTDGFLALPCKAYRAADGLTSVREYKYFVFSSGTITSTPLHSRILIIPCEEDTNGITIDQPGKVSRNVPFLKRYQTYLFQQSFGTDTTTGERVSIDLTGTVITSPSPLAVFVGHECGQVPTEASTCDHLVEQIPPHATYGQTFFVVPYALRRSGDIFKIGSVVDDNEITITCTRRYGIDDTMTTVTSTATINRGQYHTHKTLAILDGDIALGDYRRDFCCIETSKPATVMQYMLGHNVDNILIDGVAGEIGDPSMSLVPPVTQYSNNYLAKTPEEVLDESKSGFTEYLSFVSWAVPAPFFDPSLAGDLASFQVNGDTYSPPDRDMMGSGGYVPIFCKNGEVCGYGGFGPLEPGNITIAYNSSRNSQAGLFATIYGYMGEDSYAFPAGYQCEALGRELLMQRCIYDLYVWQSQVENEHYSTLS